MNEMAYETMIWAVLAALSVLTVTALFAWAPWDRRPRRKPEEHPAE